MEIFSYVGPAVIKTFLPFKGRLFEISDSINSKICSGSNILPSPSNPLAKEPIPAGKTWYPSLVSFFRFFLFDLFLYISKSIAGAINTGLEHDKKIANKRLSHLAFTIEEIVFEVAGAIIIISDHLASST